MIFSGAAVRSKEPQVDGKITEHFQDSHQYEVATTDRQPLGQSVPISFLLRSYLQAMGVPSQIETSVHIERHYAVTEIAEMWNLSPDKVRELFEREAGVLVIGESNPRRKRRYLTLRIPQSVVERVHARLSSKSVSR